MTYIVYTEDNPELDTKAEVVSINKITCVEKTEFDKKLGKYFFQKRVLRKKFNLIKKDIPVSKLKDGDMLWILNYHVPDRWVKDGKLLTIETKDIIK